MRERARWRGRGGKRDGQTNNRQAGRQCVSVSSYATCCRDSPIEIGIDSVSVVFVREEGKRVLVCMEFALFVEVLRLQFTVVDLLKGEGDGIKETKFGTGQGQRQRQR